MESAIAAHEFEKARFYSEEERKEKENLRVCVIQDSFLTAYATTRFTPHPYTLSEVILSMLSFLAPLQAILLYYLPNSLQYLIFNNEI